MAIPRRPGSTKSYQLPLRAPIMRAPDVIQGFLAVPATQEEDFATLSGRGVGGWQLGHLNYFPFFVGDVFEPEA